MPWKPETTATDPFSAKPRMMPVPSMAAIRAEPWSVGGQDRDLPALPGAGVEAHFLQREGEKAGGDLLAGGDDGVVFASNRRGAEASLTQETSSFVLPDMAETTTATS